jgi:16S rRNA processing protein RimM
MTSSSTSSTDGGAGDDRRTPAPHPGGTEPLEVGFIARSHGLRGDVVVELVSNRPERVAPGACLYTPDDGVLEVVAAQPLPTTGNNRWLVTFGGITDRPGADRLRGSTLRADPIDDPDALWVHELVDSRVVDQHGTDLGRVVAVEANPASDLLVLESGVLVPLRFVTATGEGSVTVDIPPGLLEL